MKVRFRAVDWNYRIAGIKAVRTLTQMGLKEAKELVDAAYNTVQEFNTAYDEDMSRRIMEEGHLQIVSMPRPSPMKTSLVALACEATKDGDYDLAKDIIDVLKRHS